MISFDKLTWMRQRLLDLSEPTPEWWAYVKKHRIDLHEILPECGTFGVALCKAFETVNGQYVFEFDPDGLPCVVIEAQSISKVDGLNEYITQDLVAWPIGSPGSFATAMGPSAGSAFLGPLAAIRLPRDRTPVKLHRNPESWLLSKCHGGVILKPEAADLLVKIGGPFIAEDFEHAVELRGLVGRKYQILVPSIERIAA